MIGKLFSVGREVCVLVNKSDIDIQSSAYCLKTYGKDRCFNFVTLEGSAGRERGRVHYICLSQGAEIRLNGFFFYLLIVAQIDTHTHTHKIMKCILRQDLSLVVIVSSEIQ